MKAVIARTKFIHLAELLVGGRTKDAAQKNHVALQKN
jgi:hypothetical protein